MARIHFGSLFYLPTTCLSTSGMNHTYPSISQGCGVLGHCLNMHDLQCLIPTCNSNFSHYLQFVVLYVGSWPSDHYFHSVCLSVCSFVCLSVCLCRVFLSRLWSDFDQTRTYVMCLGL